MNLEALISALVPGRSKGGVEAAPGPHPESPLFQDWLQQESQHIPPLPEPHSAENTVVDRASRRAGDLTPVAAGSAIAFAERPLLVETSLEFGLERPGLSDIRWIGEVLQYRIADFLHGWSSAENGDRSARPQAQLPIHYGRDHRPNPADTRPQIFSIIPASQAVAESSPLPVPEGDSAAESARPAVGRRDQTAGALTARLMAHFGRLVPNGPLVHLQPEQDGLWRLFLRLPKLSDGELAGLRDELTSLMNAYGLKLGTFEIVETQNGETQ